MVLVVLTSVVTTALAGLLVKWLLELKNYSGRITWREYGIGVAISPFLAILVAWGGWALARNSQLTFQEYWNGWEVAAVKEFTQCTRDGPCVWEYNCDPYWVTVCNEVCSGSGDDRSCYQECHQEIRYHSCPYVDKEYHFYTDTTLGRYAIAANVFPDNPQAHHWRASTPIPQNVISRAGTGEPSFWVAARDRCQNNRPGPVTARRDYVNYILASERTLMKEYSSDIEDYKSRNLLPALNTGVESFYHANKVYFVGWQPQNILVWQSSLEYLNGNLGNQLQGDLHLVIVKNESVTNNPERYSLALKAYWQDKNVFGSKSLSKNGIVVLVGTKDGLTVSWSRAFTGMPLGNEKLIVVMRDGLEGLSLTPELMIGPLLSRRDKKGTYYPPDGRYGAIQRVVWGLDDPATKFKRASMAGGDEQSGFLYLKNEIRPSAGQMWAIFIVTFLLCCGVWIWAASHYDPNEGSYHWRRQ